MLPGTVALAGAAANNDKGAVASLAYVDVATSTTANITAPGGIMSGDLGIYIDAGQGSGSAPTAVTPSGFTNFFNQTGGESRVMISYKVLAGTETTLTGMNAATQDGKVFLVYRPSSAITAVVPLAQASWNKQISVSGDPSSQTTNMSGKAAPIIFLGLSWAESANGAFTTASPGFNSTHAAGQVTVGRKLYNSEPQNHTIDMGNLAGGSTLISGYIQVN